MGDETFEYRTQVLEEFAAAVRGIMEQKYDPEEAYRIREAICPRTAYLAKIK
ncbi:hypothetical protein KY337_01130 [Candidatus Woesearchaeota archaeon]|nr:hypothetical protein [Candidatus Woesearchaeota archaeon]